MRRIDLIVIHCSATRANCSFPVTKLIRCHAKRFGFTGYHYYITRDGTVHTGRPLSQPGAHCKGHNQHSIGVCYEGGLDAYGEAADTRTKAQRKSLRTLLTKLHDEFPDAIILGHRDFPNVHKSCPCFDARKEYAVL